MNIAQEGIEISSLRAAIITESDAETLSSSELKGEVINQIDRYVDENVDQTVASLQSTGDRMMQFASGEKLLSQQRSHFRRSGRYYLGLINKYQNHESTSMREKSTLLHAATGLETEFYLNNNVSFVLPFNVAPGLAEYYYAVARKAELSGATELRKLTDLYPTFNYGSLQTDVNDPSATGIDLSDQVKKYFKDKGIEGGEYDYASIRANYVYEMQNRKRALGHAAALEVLPVRFSFEY